MPNIRRTFPGSSRSNEEKDEEDYQPVYRAGGKQFGGKGMRPDDDDDDDSDESESEEEEAPPQQLAVNRGSGKQLGGGKYLRPSHDDDEDDDDENADSEEEEEEEDEAPPEPEAQPIRVMPRTGGKNFLRPPVNDESDEVDSDEDDEEEEQEQEVEEVRPPPPPQTYQVMGRGTGKSLARMVPTHESEESEDSDEDEEEEVDDPVEEVKIVEIEKEKPAPVPVQIAPAPTAARGKQLRRTEPPRESQKPTTIASGKQLRMTTHDDDNDDDDDDEDEVIVPSGGGKQLRRIDKQSIIPEPDDEEEDDDDEEEEDDVEEIVKPVVAVAPPGGKRLKQPEKKPAPAKTVDGGKQLRRIVKDDDEEDDDDEDMSVESEPSDDDDDDDDYGASKAKTKQKPKAKPKPKPKTKAKPRAEPKEKKDDSKKKLSETIEEFGDDDRSSDEEAELDINKPEGLIKDDADRKYLDSLPELDREAILAERYERKKAEQDMKKAIEVAKRQDEAKGKPKDDKVKEKSYTEADEDLAKSLNGRRSSVRERDATGVKSKKAAALAALKKERKIHQDESSGDSEMDFGDDDEDSDEDYDEEKPWQKKPPPKSSVSRLERNDESGEDMDIDDDDDDDGGAQSKDLRKGNEQSDAGNSALNARHEDFVKVTIPRRRLERWCNEPFFQAAVLECYVRILIGEDDHGEKVYRLCEIVDVKITNKSYKFPITDKSKKPVSTNKMLRLKFGNSERDFPMFLVSDTPPTEADVQKYITNQKNFRLEVLSKRRATKLRRLQDELVNNYTYTTADIEKNLQRRKTMGKSTANLGSETTRIAIAVKGARDSLLEADQKLAVAKKSLLESSANPAEEAQLELKVHDCTDAVKAAKKFLEEKLEEERVMLETVQDRKRRLTKREKDLNWAKVNKRALHINQQADREGYKAQKEAELSKFPGKKDEFNPYARRRVKPKVLWKVGAALLVEDDTKGEEKKESKEETVKIEQLPLDVSTTPSLIQETHKGSSLSESHQFAIDEESLVQSSVLGTFGLGGSTSITRKRQRVRKGISLLQYLEMKEQGTI